MLRHHVLDERLHLCAVDVEVHERRRNATIRRWTFVDLLVLHEVARHDETVFDIVDTDRRRLAEGDGAQVARDLQPASMRLFHCRCEFVSTNVHVRLERRRAAVSPVRHHLRRIGRSRERVHLVNRQPWPVEIRRRRIEPWSHRSAAVDRALQLEVRVARHVARGTRRRDAAGEIEPREAESLFVVDGAAARRIEHVLVHHDESGHH